MKKLMIVVCLVLWWFSTLLAVPGNGNTRTMDIAEFSGDNGRVVSHIPRPALGTAVYTAQMDYSPGSNSVMVLSNTSVDKFAEVEINAFNFNEGLAKLHMLRIGAGETYRLTLDSLGDVYDTFILVSLEPFSAVMENPEDEGECTVETKALAYDLPEGSESLITPITVTIGGISGGSGGSPPDPGLICSGQWKLICATRDKCGDYSASGWGEVYLSYPFSIYKWYQIYWREQEPLPIYCSHAQCYGGFTRGADYCSTHWNLYGLYNHGCPWRAHNCRGEMYWVIPDPGITIYPHIINPL